ncbi:MAG: hypothetical protein HY077_07550 [Elusimicrobia bacterium]|nr:hypothetical protein [Elusimicrobiota bacterium]
MLRARFALVLAFLSAVRPAWAAFEDSGFSPRAVAMGSSFTAVTDDPVSVFYNPAALGFINHTSFQTSYLRQFHIAAGEVNQDLFTLSGAIPVKQELINGTLSPAFLYNNQNNVGIERSVGMSYGSRSLYEFDGGQVELGGTFRVLQRTYSISAGAPTRIGLDFAGLMRFWDKYTFGVSLLNFDGPPINGPNFKDRAPAMIKLGVAESVRGFLFAFDITKREPSGGHPGTANLGAGIEHWWATARHGSYALRTGGILSERDKMWNAGVGWRLFGAQVDYALTIPMTGTSIFGHAVSLSYRFGQSNPEGEYERVLAEELKYRKDLTQALEAGEVKQWRLAEELNTLRDEMMLLRRQLIDKTTSEAQARRRLQELEERHRQAEEKFRKMQAEANRSKDVLFREDWTAYQKLKLGGAPDAVLLDQVTRILRQYKDAGVDLGEANQELVRLRRGR